MSNTCLTPPIAKKIPKTTEIHGTSLIDQYAWLREKENPEVIDYLNQENAYTDQQLGHLTQFQDQLFEEMKGRIKEDDETCPYRDGDYFYFSQTIKGKQYSIHKRTNAQTQETEVLFDENLMAEGLGYFDMDSYQISPNQKLAAFSIDTTGYEEFVLQIKNLETGEILPDKIKNVGWSFEWADDSTIYYNMRDKAQRCYAVMRHKLGQESEKDELIFEENDEKRSVYIWKSNDRKYLFHSASSTLSKEVHYLNLEKNESQFKVFCSRQDKHEYSVEHRDGTFYILTNSNDSTNFRLMQCSVEDTNQEKWQELIPHDINTKQQSIIPFQKFLVLKQRSQGLTNFYVYFGQNDPKNHQIETPENIYAMWASYNEVFDSDLFRFNYSSLKTPRTTFDYNVYSKERELKKQQEVFNYNPDNFVSERRFIQSRDGQTQIPVSIVHKKDIQFPAPTLLYGYGSYGICIDTHFNSNYISMLERGVVYVIAHIRGGGEMGKQWQNDGKFLKKMNTFNDFIDTADYLHKENISTPQLTAIQGGSAGGLLMGAVSNLRPDISKACIAEVPFVDVINTMLDTSIPLTTGEYEEWGNPNEKEYFDYMLSYSPYDQIKAQNYPNMLITGGLNDPRVQYWEPAKWVAKLRELKLGDNQVLLKMKMGSGHMGATGRYDYIKEKAFTYSYILDQLNLYNKQ